MKKPINPDVISAIKIESNELTATLPSNNVQSKWLPLRLTGSILFANWASLSASADSKGGNVNSSRLLQSNPISPNVSPEKRADKKIKTTMRRIRHHSGAP